MLGRVGDIERVTSGTGRVGFGRSEDAGDEAHDVRDGWAIVVPAGVWHNVVNTGEGELKLYSPYAPPEHPDGTVHRTKADAMAAEHDRKRPNTTEGSER